MNDCIPIPDHGAIIVGVILGILTFLGLIYHAFACYKKRVGGGVDANPPLEPTTSKTDDPLAPSDIELGIQSSSVSKADGDDAISVHVEAVLEKTMKSEGADAEDLVGGASAVHQWMSGGGSGGFWSMAYIVINFVQNFTLVSLFDVEWPASWSYTIRWFNFSYFDIKIFSLTIMESDPELAKWISFLGPLLFHPLLIARFDNGLFRRMGKTRRDRIINQVSSEEAWTEYKRILYPVLYIPLLLFTIAGIIFVFGYDDFGYDGGATISALCSFLVFLLTIFAYINVVIPNQTDEKRQDMETEKAEGKDEDMETETERDMSGETKTTRLITFHKSFIS